MILQHCGLWGNPMQVLWYYYVGSDVKVRNTALIFNCHQKQVNLKFLFLLLTNSISYSRRFVTNDLIELLLI